ncbi:MAG: helix-turn-helix transcriptional regulator [Chloroflexota bacterium]
MRPDRLKELRQKRGYSQEDIAKFVQTTQSQVGRWERGDVVPSSNALGKIAEFFDVTADYLLGLVDEPTSTITLSDLSPDEQELIAYLRSGALLKAFQALAAFSADRETEQ